MSEKSTGFSGSRSRARDQLLAYCEQHQIGQPIDDLNEISCWLDAVQRTYEPIQHELAKLHEERFDPDSIAWSFTGMIREAARLTLGKGVSLAPVQNRKIIGQRTQFSPAWR